MLKFKVVHTQIHSLTHALTHATFADKVNTKRMQSCKNMLVSKLLKFKVVPHANTLTHSRTHSATYAQQVNAREMLSKTDAPCDCCASEGGGRTLHEMILFASDAAAFTSRQHHEHLARTCACVAAQGAKYMQQGVISMLQSQRRFRFLQSQRRLQSQARNHKSQDKNLNSKKKKIN